MWANWANKRTAIFSAALIATALVLPVAPAAAQFFPASPQYPDSPQYAPQPPGAGRRHGSFGLAAAAGGVLSEQRTGRHHHHRYRHAFLYLTLGGGRAMRYGIGVGRQGFTWSGTETIVRKAEWPDWFPPAEMVARQPYLPRFVAGGPGNPLGARAMYLGNTDYRIHGTNDPSSIGKHMSSGCIRLLNADVIDLYSRVGIGTKVIVLPNDQRQAAIGGGNRIASEEVAQDSRIASPKVSARPASIELARHRTTNASGEAGTRHNRVPASSLFCNQSRSLGIGLQVKA